ncbi:MAG: divalent-cation tolerance protein CutA [Pseudomonadota bacterium]|nr:divalent-cation tolerance protein CutA [Pseudomonadota bacterium]
MTDLVVVYITAPDADVAARIGRLLVEEELAACCSLVPGVRSIYRWEDAIHEDAEVLMIVKTRAACVEALTARVVAVHPYTLPEVLALPVLDGHLLYLDWVRAGSTRAP